MKILILSITAGQGHHSAAKSLADAFSDIGATVSIVDVYKQIDKNLCEAVNRGYLLSTKYASKTYRVIYDLLDNYEIADPKPLAPSVVNMLLAIRFEKFIEDYSPDAIICTHIFAAQVINELKRKGKFCDIPTVGIVTDYTIHPFWKDAPLIEHIEIASELLTQRAKMKGISEDRLLPFGIPIQKKFATRGDKAEARKRFNLSPDKPCVLVMAGSMGYGDMPSLISEILRFDEGCQVLAVCGNNSRLYKKLEKKGFADNVRLFAFTNEVDILMDAADCIITKPGGLTTSEAMAKHLPMILVNPIPGQEDRNMEFFLNNGVALSVSKNFTVDEALYFLFHGEGRLEYIDKQLAILAKPDAAERLARFVSDIVSKEK